MATNKRSVVGAELPIAFTATKLSARKMGIQVVKVQPTTGESVPLSRVNLGFITLGTRKHEGRITEVSYDDTFVIDDVSLCIERLKAEVQLGLNRYVEEPESIAVWPDYPLPKLG